MTPLSFGLTLLAFAALFVLFGLHGRRAGGTAPSCGSDACGTGGCAGCGGPAECDR